MTRLIWFSAFTLALLVGWLPLSRANAEIAVPPGYINIHGAETVTYGRPADIALIRTGLTAICTHGIKAPGIGPAVADELIQVGDYAIAEGSCGNPELHLIVHRVDGRWSALPPCGRSTGVPYYNCLVHGGCRIGGGVSADYGAYGLYTVFADRCGMPMSVTKRIIAARAQMPFIASLDRKALVQERACKSNPQSDYSCPGYRPTAAMQRNLTYNDSFSLTQVAARAGDFANALRFAERAVAAESPGNHDMEKVLARLQQLRAQLTSGAITRAVAINLWNRYERLGY